MEIIIIIIIIIITIMFYALCVYTYICIHLPSPRFGHVAGMGERKGSYRILVGTPEGKRLLE